MVEATRRAVVASRDLLERIDAALPHGKRKGAVVAPPPTARTRKGPMA